MTIISSSQKKRVNNAKSMKQLREAIIEILDELETNIENIVYDAIEEERRKRK